MRAALVLLLVAGCAKPIGVESVTPVADGWLLQASRDALVIWSEHGVELTESRVGVPIKIGNRAPEDGHMGSYGVDVTEEFGWSIVVDPSLEDDLVRSDCTVAHEIGHALGLPHVDDDASLMSEGLTTCDGACCWSSYDEDALRALLEE